MLDHNFEVLAKVGDKVIDGETIIAKKLPPQVSEIIQ